MLFTDAFIDDLGYPFQQISQIWGS